MHSFCFRVAEISFFALDYKFTTKMISHGKLFDIPQFDNIECDIDKSWLKRRLKERDPNKLGTRNWRYSAINVREPGVLHHASIGE
jgi:hypothetical protein